MLRRCFGDGVGDIASVSVGGVGFAGLDHDAIGEAVAAERRGHGEIAGATAEFIKAEFRVGGGQRQPRLRQEFVLARAMVWRARIPLKAAVQ